MSSPIYLLYIWSSQLWFLCSCSGLLDPICLNQIAQISSVFCFFGPSNFFENNSQLRYTSPSPSMYYGIEVINGLNIEFIVILTNRMQYPTRNYAGILMLNSNPDLHFFPGCAEQVQNWFWN